MMDESTYTDPDVARYVNQHFLAVRVDNDHRPDINARYNVGGWPSTVFLTPHGGYIAGATYLPPDQFLAMLLEVQRAYSEQKPDLYEKANSMLRQRRDEVAKVSAGGEVDGRLVDRIARRAVGAYDVAFGGFGEEPKFPGIFILQLLLHLYRTTGEEFYRVILRKTLDGMAQGALFDSSEGGFFRYAAKADWSEAQHEKMLEDNIGLGRVFMDASLLLNHEDYGRIALQTIDYLLAYLFDEEASGFRGSQGAHSDYFGLSLESRRQQPAPAVDPYCYSNWSADAASFLLEASWKLQRPELVSIAQGVLGAIDAMLQKGELTHVYTSAGPAQGSGGQLLTDWVHWLNALMDCHTWTASGGDYLERAKTVAAEVLDRFFDPVSGGFFDIESSPEAVGFLKVREKPLPENVVAVRGFLKLHQANGDPKYREAAQQTLSAYAEANRSYGEHAAGYAVAVDQFLNRPVEITVEGHPENPSTQDMLRAGTRVAYPHLVIRLVSSDVESRVQAHICLDTVCLPPISDPAELAQAVQEAVSPRESPFENVLGTFTGF
jgi:uncharacterized protein YyaL (SSP411 family)